MENLVLLFFGICGGFLAGLLGVGGGIIFIPILAYYFEKWGFSQADIVKATLANSMILVFGSGLSGTLKQLAEKTLNYKNILLVGIPGGLVSFALSSAIAYGDWYKPHVFKLVFSAFILAGLIKMFTKQNNEIETQLQKPLNITNALIVGTLAGIVVAISGLGGGMVMVPMFQLFMGLNFKDSSKLSLSVIPWLTLFPLVGYLLNPVQLQVVHTGYIVWPAVLPALLGVFIFAPIGIKTAVYINTKILRIIFASLSIFILIKMVYELY